MPKKKRQKRNGMIAIYCRRCGGMIFACEDSPFVIIESAGIIKKYNKSKHIIKKVTRYEVRHNFKGCIPGCTMFSRKRKSA
ncbi:MAG: hypothetical protein GY797_17460 [Deltaproteobacteria bacterium]|nr:hypothetical protein [Deltaproteobacteria bacterium]